MNRFEHLVHTAPAHRGRAVGRPHQGELWVEAQPELFGDSVEITDGYRMWWSYVPHFINTPGYVYAYAYGQLLALSVYGRYRERGRDVRPALPRAARRRRLARPEELGAIVGIDLADPGFWDAGLALVEEQLTRRRGARRRGVRSAARSPCACGSAPPGARPR